MPSFLDGSNDFQRALPRPADELHHERFKPRLPEGAWVGSTMNPAWKCYTGGKVDGIPESSNPRKLPIGKGKYRPRVRRGASSTVGWMYQ